MGITFFFKKFLALLLFNILICKGWEDVLPSLLWEWKTLERLLLISSPVYLADRKLSNVIND